MTWSRCLAILIPALISDIGFGACKFNRVLFLVPDPVVIAKESQTGLSTSPTSFFSQAILNETSHLSCSATAIAPSWKPEELTSNGLAIFERILTWQSSNQALKDTPIELVAHGLSGLYALHAVHENRLKGSPLNIRKVHLVSVPLDGLELAELFAKNRLVGTQLNSLFAESYPDFDLMPLITLPAERVRELLLGLRLPEDVSVHSYAGLQTEAPSPGNSRDIAYLSPVLAALDFLIDQKSDGVVSLESALSQPALLSTDGSQFTNHHIHREVVIPLDHFEQFTDSRYLQSIGFRHVKHLEGQQKQMIRDILTDK